MDYPVAMFSDCIFSRFGYIVRMDTHTRTDTDADERLTPATLTGVKKKK